ncbi:hypothetical protein [Candidatus Palauibacter sp.]|uniref:hypothetical protein n=1 Tax=Candidatus Palauibacter sp. TaxID=3101350 RepID=UPI003CC583A9
MAETTPTEREGWAHHMARYPPVETILAAIWFTVARGLGNRDADLSDMGYWLESPDQRKRRRADEARAARAAKVRATDAAYMRGKRERGPDGG